MLISQLTKLSGLLAVLLRASLVVGHHENYFQEVNNVEKAVTVSYLDQLRKGVALEGDNGAVGHAKLQKDGRLRLSCTKTAAVIKVKVIFYPQGLQEEVVHQVKHFGDPTCVPLPSGVDSVGLVVGDVRAGRLPAPTREASASNPNFFKVSEEAWGEIVPHSK